ncbi:MAG: hypothetical protein PWQ22_993 [Archaeoglobaceae archaeon]|nr:hypothetical protein [Archaeoglobaceae archaeon]
MRDFNVKALIIENGVEENLAEIEWKPEDYVLYSGRIEKYKNVDRLAKIVKILNMKLLIIGDGPYKEKLKKNLKSMDLEYEMMPFQPYDKYLEILSKARFFALLSKKEQIQSL